MTAQTSRYLDLVRETTGLLSLDLASMSVLTELASGYFTSTPLIAALAGADVYAVGKDSRFGTFSELKKQLMREAEAFGVEQRIRCLEDRYSRDLSGVDIVTNCGFLRPIDRELLGHVGDQCVVSYMCENWETRPGDVDLQHCRERGIPVYFSDENAWGMNVFRMCGSLLAKLCYEAELEVMGNRIAVLSSDPFGNVIAETLGRLGASVSLCAGPGYRGLDEGRWDAVIVSEYNVEDAIVGGRVDVRRVVDSLRPGGVIMQFAGTNQLEGVPRGTTRVVPDSHLPPKRMSKTLSHLGPLPVVRLQAIGLKVGRAACEGRRRGLVGGELDRFVLCRSPAQLPLGVARAVEQPS